MDATQLVSCQFECGIRLTFSQFQRTATTFKFQKQMVITHFFYGNPVTILVYMTHTFLYYTIFASVVTDLNGMQLVKNPPFFCCYLLSS